MPTPTTSIQHCTGGTSQFNTEEKEIEGIHFGKGVKLFIHR